MKYEIIFHRRLFSTRQEYAFIEFSFGTKALHTVKQFHPLTGTISKRNNKPLRNNKLKNKIKQYLHALSAHFSNNIHKN